MKPPPDKWLTAITYSPNQSCSQTTYFKPDENMSLESQPNCGISLVATASPICSQVTNPRSFHPPHLSDTNHPEVSHLGTTASKLPEIPQLSSFQQLVLKLVICGSVVTLPGLIGLTLNNTDWELHLRVSSKSNQVEEATKSRQVETSTELTPVERVTESK